MEGDSGQSSADTSLTPTLTLILSLSLRLKPLHGLTGCLVNPKTFFQT